MWLPSSQLSTRAFAAQGLQKLLWNYNLASRVLPMWKAAGGAPQSVVQANNNNLSPVRCQLSSISSSWGSVQIRLPLTIPDYCSPLRLTARLTQVGWLVSERVFHLPICYFMSSSREQCTRQATRTTTLESARPSTRMTVGEVWKQSNQPFVSQYWSSDRPPYPPPKWHPDQTLAFCSLCS